MLLENIYDRILEHVGDKKAFIEINIGPAIDQIIELDDSAIAIPLGPIGNSANIAHGEDILRFLGIPADKNFFETAENQGKPFNHSVALVYTGLSEEEYELAAPRVRIVAASIERRNLGA